MGRARYLPHVAAFAAALAVAAAEPKAQTAAVPVAAAEPPASSPASPPAGPAVERPPAGQPIDQPPTAEPPIAGSPIAEPPVSLVADSIAVDRAAGTVTARGNVEVHYQGRVLRAREIVYSDPDQSIRAVGPLTLTDPDVGVLVAAEAEMTADLVEGLIASARLLLGEQLQISASEVRRTEGRYTTLHNTVASTCEVCIGGAAPTWAIRAERIIRDEETQQIHLRNATLELFGLPVFWLPYLRIPDPTVTRASGLLVPEFRQSQIYGLGLRVPYYRVLGPHADATLAPFVTGRGGTLFEGKYRRRFARGALDLTGVVSPDDRLGDRGARGTVAASGFYDLGQGYRGEIDAAFVSDDAFLQQYDYSDADRLTSTARVLRTRPQDYAELGVVGFQSLRPDEDSTRVPLILPDARYRHLWQDTPVGGRFAIDANSVGVLRDGGRDVLRFGGGADWREDWIVGPGLHAATSAGAAADAWAIREDVGERNESRLAPWVRAELRWPLARAGERALQVIEPVAELAWSETWGGDGIPNEDSQLPEFDETNLFALNRYPGRDRVETGLRANLGLTYARYDPAGWTAQATFGRVVRFTDRDQFAEGTGLAGRTSDWVGAVELGLGASFSAINRVRFDDGLDVRRNELSVLYETPRTGLSASWVYLAEDATDPAVGAQPEQSEVQLAARYRVLPNWQLRGSWRYDVVNDSTLRAGGGVTYGNECAEIDISATRRFTTTGDVPASTSVGFVVRLVGLGVGSTEAWPRRVCNG